MNILWGLNTYLSQLSPPGICYGVVGGLGGLIGGSVIEVKTETLNVYRNQGGIELLCRYSYIRHQY